MNMKHLDILLVDDDDNDCALFGVAVNEAGLSIDFQTVADGGNAICYLEGRGGYADRKMHPIPELVLLDLCMRVTGAFDFLDWRRASALFSSLPVILFSAYAYKGAIDTALSLGADAFIAKPFGFEKLLATVRQIWVLGMKQSVAKSLAMPPFSTVSRITCHPL